MSSVLGRGAIVLLLWPVLGISQGYQPFISSNLSPAVFAMGGPDWVLPTDSPPKLQAVLANSWASHFALSSEADEFLIIDGETWRAELGVYWQFRPRWQLSLVLPSVRHSGGRLDDFIDVWHETFSLPDGGRDKRENDLMEFTYVRAGNSVLSISDDQSGIGDVRVGFARSLKDDGASSVWGALKLPTGEAARLTGSGGLAFTMGYNAGKDAELGGRELNWFWGTAIGYRQTGDLEAWRPNRWVAYGALGGRWRLRPKIAAKMQLAVATAPFDSELRALGSPSLELILGAELVLGDRGILDIGVSEDLVVEAAPDVTFTINARFDF